MQNSKNMTEMIGLLLCLLGVMSFVGPREESKEPLPPRKNVIASAFVCPGMTAVWIDDSTVQCAKEK